MEVTKEDILVDIPDEDLPRLAEMYRKHEDRFPHVYSIIKTGIEWIQKSETRYMIFMSPNNCWKQDGTFFVLLQYSCFHLFISTLDESGKNVYDALISTKRLDTTFLDSHSLLFCVHNKLYPIVVESMNMKNIEIVMEIPCTMYSISKEEAIKFDIEYPPEVYVKKLDEIHASIIDQEWPHRNKDSEKLILLLLVMNGGYGVFLKSNDELVSWVTLSMLGQLSTLQTKEDHKKKGYATLVTKVMSKKLAEKGYNPFATVLVGNAAATKMFQKIGFKDLGIATYTFYNKNQQK